MKKVLIISYFFPPANFVGAVRTASWAKYLAENDIYPIIITRKWNENQKELTDPVLNNEKQVEIHDHCEIVRLPYKKSLRDKFSEHPWLKPFQKALTLKKLIFSNYFVSSLPFANFYTETRKRLQNDPEIKAVIASGRPFQSFAIGHQLKKEFGILWIPDYRDEWTTHQNLGEQNFIQKQLNKLDRKSELKWTSNADFFLSVSDPWVDSISNFINKKGKTVYNGYDKLKVAKSNFNTSDPLAITYAGTLYPSQKTNIFIDACLCLLSSGHKLDVMFIGANVIPGEEKKLRLKTKGFEANFQFIDRLPKPKLETYIQQTDLLFLTGFENVKGWYPVKLFEYYATGKPILLCPSDNNVMESFIRESNSGFIANSIEECRELIFSLIQKKEAGLQINQERNLIFGETFSRKHQASNLAKLIHDQLRV